MKLRRYILCLLMFLVQSCSDSTHQASSDVDKSSSAEASVFIDATSDLVLTSIPTFLPSSTTFPTLSPDGPYLAFAPNRTGPLVLLDQNGLGREIIDLPIGARPIGQVESSISPTGEWFVVYIGDPYYPPYSLSLLLINLKNGSIREVGSLLADDYPDNLIPIAEQIAESNPNPAVRSVDDWIGPVSMAFKEGIIEFEWSPDGQQLAFSAQIDGPYSDIYVYQIADGTIHRITNDMRFINWIDWSPNGDFILFQEAIIDQVYSLSSLHVAKADGSQIWDLHPADTLWWGLGNWVSPYTVMIYHTGGDAHAPAELYLLDILTDQRTPLWNGIAYEYAFDPENNMLAVYGKLNNQDGSQSDQYTGLYLVYPDLRIQPVIESRGVTTLNNPKIVPFDRPPSIFVGCNDDGAFFINKDGSADFLTNDSCHRVFPSPENNWILVIPVEGQAQLYTSDGEYLSEFYSFTAGLDSVIWSPDSLTLYTVTAGALTQITIPDGKRSVIYECTAGQLPCYMIPTNYAWLYW